MNRQTVVRHLGAAVISIGLLGVAGCNQEQPTAAVPAGLPVEVAAPLAQNVVQWQRFSGRFEASQRVAIRPRVSGYLQAVHVVDGQSVAEGDLLFVIDPRPYRIALDQARARFERAQNRFARAEVLYRKRALAREAYDLRREEREIAKAELAQAELDLEFTQVRAPFAGRVGQSALDIGALVEAGSAQPLISLVAQQPIEFHFEGSEANLLMPLRELGGREALANTQTPVFVQLQGEQGYSYRGELRFIDNALDSATGTLHAYAEFANADGLLDAGLFGRMRMALAPAAPALLVPDSAIGTEQVRKFVYVMNAEQRAERRYLTLGPLAEEVPGYRVVFEGLKPDEQVVVSNLAMVRAGVALLPKAPQDEQAVVQL